MKCYKGFEKLSNGLLKCRDFIYKIGKTYEISEDEIEMCKKGFHACRELHQCWYFYPHKNKNIIYCEVECEGKIIENHDNSGKICCSKITIGKEIDSSKFPFFIYITYFAKDYARIIREDNKKSFIDKNGNLIGNSNTWYLNCIFFTEGYALVQRENYEYVYLSIRGNEFKTKEEAQIDSKCKLL